TLLVTPHGSAVRNEHPDNSRLKARHQPPSPPLRCRRQHPPGNTARQCGEKRAPRQLTPQSTTPTTITATPLPEAAPIHSTARKCCATNHAK
ncbi:MAG: hypothetical protein II856_05425, partial [Bacteroidales bacterium]|nr:hypothetical protein [Bacteroidales bacterium]